MILFGGAEGVSEEPQGDTWALDVRTGEWTQLDPASAPSPRAWHVMTTDAETRQIVLFGGGPTRNECTAETWLFDPATDTWEQAS